MQEQTSPWKPVDEAASAWTPVEEPPPPGAVKRFGSELWNQVNPVNTVVGARDAAAHPISTVKNDASARKAVYDKAEESFKKGDYAGGAAHLVYSMIPLLGPQLDQAGEKFASGDYAGGAGMSTGIGLNLAGPKAISNLKIPGVVKSGVQGLSERMYQSALKPVPSTAASAVQGMVKTGLDAAIPVSEGGAAKLSSLIEQYNDAAKAEIQARGPARLINPGKVAQRLDATEAKFQNQVNPSADVQAIENARQEFLDNFKQAGAVRNMTTTEAQSMKSGTYAQLKGKAYGELKSASVEAQKALARGLKEELEAQIPELKDLNANQAKFLNLDAALERALNRIQNRNMMRLGGPIAAGVTGGMTGSPVIGSAVGVMKAILDDPMLQSKIAIALNRSVNNGSGMTAPYWKTRVATYANALGQAVEQEKQQGR